MAGVIDFFTGKSAREDRRKAEKAARKERKALERAASEDAREEARVKELALLRKKKGRAATLLTGGQGLGGFGDDRSPKATLLG